MNMHKPKNKLVSVELKHFWCMNEPRANTNSQDSPQLRFAGSHHLPPYSILCAQPQANTQISFCPGAPKWEFRNSQNWDSYNFGGPQLCVKTSD